jgi:hypothetical protein
MLKRPRTDFWRVGCVPLPQAQVSAERLRALRDEVVWLPDAGPWRYLADPFGLVRGAVLHVFVEAFDYRIKHAVIERHDYSLTDGVWLGHSTVLAQPFHLSYPYVFEHAGETFMVPESHQAGEIALYRADAGLNHWTRETALMKNITGADATLLQFGGQWWMFYAVVGAQARDQRELHLACAPSLTGPWREHPNNPVVSNLAGARPGGTPMLDAGGGVVLPVQDCSQGYGSALRFLRFQTLDLAPLRFEYLPERLTGDLVSKDHTAGLHTLSGCAGFSFIDVKRVDTSRKKQWLDLKRRLRRAWRRVASTTP